MENQSDGQACVINNVAELTQRAEALVQSYRHGTDDAPAFVAQDIARLPAPYAIAVTAAMCEMLDKYEQQWFTALLLEVAQGRYRSVFDRGSE